MDPESFVIGGVKQLDTYNSGGEWLYAVFRTGIGGQITGFIHNEDHYWVNLGAGGYFGGGGIAYKSISIGITEKTSYFVEKHC